MQASTTLFAALTGATALAAQTPLHIQYSPGTPYHFSDGSGTGIGDVDGDGVPDYAVGDRGKGSNPGYVVVYSGATGHEITTLLGDPVPDSGGNCDRFGHSIAGLGDVDGDAVPDLLVGVSNDDAFWVKGGSVQVISGSDWSVIRHQPPPSGTQFGSLVGPLGDANGDGVSEYLVCQKGNTVFCFDGATGALLWTRVGGVSDQLRVGPDIGVRPDGSPRAGARWASGAALHEIHGPSQSGLGLGVSWVGDLDGDQRTEFAAAYHISPVGEPHIQVYDGATGLPSFGMTGDSGLGKILCGVGDQDGDGVPDIAVQDGHLPELRSGADGSLIHEYDVTPMAPSNTTVLLTSIGDPSGLDDLLAECSLLDDLLVRVPHHAPARWTLAETRMILCQLALERRDHEAARAHGGESVDSLEDLLAAEPGGVKYRRLLTNVAFLLGTAEQLAAADAADAGEERARWSEAASWFERLLALSEELDAQGSLPPHEADHAARIRERLELACEQLE